MHAAPLADHQPALAGQFVTRANAGGNDDHLRRQCAAVVEEHPFDLAFTQYLFRALVQMNANAEDSIFFTSSREPASSTWRGINRGANSIDVRFESQVVGRLGRLQP